MMRSLLAVSLLVAPALAQVPYDSLLVCEHTSSASATALHYLDPLTGAVTPVTVPTSGPTVFLDSARLDPADPTKIYLAKNAPSATTAQLSKATMQGAVATSLTSFSAGLKDVITRLEIYNGFLYYIIPTGTNAGMWQWPLGVGGAPTLRNPRPDIADVVTLGGKVYTINFLMGQPSVVEEFDPATGQLRVLGTNYPSAHALGHFTGNLVAGADNGDVFIIDVNTGAMLPLFSPGKGAVVAIASREGSPTFTIATANAVYGFGAYTTPIYTSANPISDLVIGIHDQASFILYGQGCPGSNGTPTASANGLPSIANSGFKVQVANAKPSSTGVLLFGVSRTQLSGLPLPLSLASVGAPSCFLNTDILIQIGFTTDGSGNGSVKLPIPPLQYKGGRFTGQFAIRDSGANTLGLVFSNGFEGTVR